MIDKKLDNLKNPNRDAHSESELTNHETTGNKEKEGERHEKTTEKKSPLEKYANKLIPSKAKKVIPAIPQIQDEISVKIEKILETGLGDEYAKLSPIAKQEFKIKGEETTAKIRELLQTTHIKVKKIKRQGFEQNFIITKKWILLVFSII